MKTGAGVSGLLLEKAESETGALLFVISIATKQTNARSEETEIIVLRRQTELHLPSRLISHDHANKTPHSSTKNLFGLCQSSWLIKSIAAVLVLLVKSTTYWASGKRWACLILKRIVLKRPWTHHLLYRGTYKSSDKKGFIKVIVSVNSSYILWKTGLFYMLFVIESDDKAPAP